MSQAIGSAHLRLSASTGKFESDIDKAQSRLAQFGKSAQQTSKELQRVRSSVSGLASGAGSFTRLAENSARAAGANEAVTGSLGSMTTAIYSAQHGVMALAMAKKALLGPIGLLIAAGGTLAAVMLYNRKVAQEAAETERKRKEAIDAVTGSLSDELLQMRLGAAEFARIQDIRKGATQQEVERNAAIRERIRVEKEINTLTQQGVSLQRSLMTAQEKANDELDRAKDLYALGSIDLETLTRAQERHRLAVEKSKPAQDHFNSAADSVIQSIWQQTDALRYNREELEMRNAVMAGADERGMAEIRHAQQMRREDEDHLRMQDQIRRNDEDAARAADIAWEAEKRRSDDFYRNIQREIDEEARLNKLKVDMRWQAVQSMTGALVALTSIGARESKKQFELHKKVSVGEAGISTAAGIMAVFKDPLTPWWSKLGNASLVAATGAAQIAAIRSTTFDGGGAITSPQDAGSSTSSAPATNVTLSLRGDESFSGASLGRVFEQFNEYLKDGGSLNVQVS